MRYVVSDIHGNYELFVKLLKKINCIEQYRKKGNYIITDAGQKVIAKMDEIESIIGGTKQCC